MTCFQCGAPDGSATQACKRCLEKGKDFNPVTPSETVEKDFGWTLQKTLRLLGGDSVRILIVLLIMVLCLCYYLGVHRYLINILTPLPKRVERLCIQEALVASDYFRSHRPLPKEHIFNPGGSWEQGLVKLYGRDGGFRMLGGLRMGIQGMCLDIRKMCDNPEHIDACKMLVPNPLRRK